MKKIIQYTFTLFSLTFLSPLIALASPLTEYERNILATVLVLEATADGEEGMQAVLNVIYNRAGRNLDNVMAVVAKPGQFTSINSVTKRQHRNYGPIIQKAMKNGNFNEAVDLVMLMERGELEDITFGATHFHSSRRPYWASSMNYLVTVGGHRFYTTRRSIYQAGL